MRGKEDNRRKLAYSKITREQLTGEKFVYDPRVQRPEDPRKLTKMIAEFDAEGLGLITISRRANGAEIVLDGQHRHKAAMANGYAGKFDSKVYHGLSLEDEAYLFRILNTTTKASRLALFNVAVTEQDPQALRVEGVLSLYGLSASNNSFAAISAAQRVARLEGGVDALSWALDVVIRAYGPEPKHLDGRLIEALGMLRVHNKDAINTQSLINNLAAKAGGVSGVIGDARTLQLVRKGPLVTNVIDTLVGIHNHAKKKEENKLPEWTRT